MTQSTITVWSKPNCPQCDQAKHLLVSHDMIFEEKKIGTPGVTREQLLQLVPTARSVPQIFFGDTHIGGLAELKQRLMK